MTYLIGEKLRDYPGLWNDFAIVVDGRYETSWIDGKVAGIAGTIEVDCHFFEWELKFCKGYVCSVCPGTGPICVEDDFWC